MLLYGTEHNRKERAMEMKTSYHKVLERTMQVNLLRPKEGKVAKYLPIKLLIGILLVDRMFN